MLSKKLMIVVISLSSSLTPKISWLMLMQNVEIVLSLDSKWKFCESFLLRHQMYKFCIVHVHFFNSSSFKFIKFLASSP